MVRDKNYKEWSQNAMGCKKYTLLHFSITLSCIQNEHNWLLSAAVNDDNVSGIAISLFY